jgi:hypothetical protein
MGEWERGRESEEELGSMGVGARGRESEEELGSMGVGRRGRESEEEHGSMGENPTQSILSSRYHPAIGGHDHSHDLSDDVVINLA